MTLSLVFFFQADDGFRDAQESRGLGVVYKGQDTNILLAINITSGRFQGRFVLAFFLHQLFNINFGGWADAFTNAMHVAHYSHG